MEQQEYNELTSENTKKILEDEIGRKTELSFDLFNIKAKNDADYIAEIFKIFREKGDIRVEYLLEDNDISNQVLHTDDLKKMFTEKLSDYQNKEQVSIRLLESGSNINQEFDPNLKMPLEINSENLTYCKNVFGYGEEEFKVVNYYTEHLGDYNNLKQPIKNLDQKIEENEFFDNSQKNSDNTEGLFEDIEKSDLKEKIDRSGEEYIKSFEEVIREKTLERLLSLKYKDGSEARELSLNNYYSAEGRFSFKVTKLSKNKESASRVELSDKPEKRKYKNGSFVNSTEKNCKLGC